MRELGKIICTLGPASHTEQKILKMAQAGMVVARLNFSHVNHRAHYYMIELIRKINASYKQDIKILMDLEGYRVRVGVLKKPISLKEGKEVYLAVAGNKDCTSIPIDSDFDIDQIQDGMNIFINDGFIYLKVIKTTKNRIKAKVIIGGAISSKKGINIPKLRLKSNILTEKDKLDIEFGVKHKVDFIAQSFVRSKADIKRVIERVRPYHPACKIIAKIENQVGVKNIDGIIEISDGIMVARGDLGVSLPLYQIPYLQKDIIKRCNKKKRFVITATQMLESMTTCLRPTRAEVSDVANAVLDGSDYVMLSGETAIGKYPVETVKMMKQIVDYNNQVLV